MYHEMYGGSGSAWGWMWMALMMLLLVVVLGGLVYAAVRLALQHERKPRLRQ